MALSAFSPAPTDANHVLYVDTVADMLALTDIRDGAEARTARYSAAHATGDGSGGEYVYHATGRTGITADGGFFHNGSGADDYWELKVQTVAKLLQFGAIGDGTTDNSTAIAAWASSSASDLVVSGGTFNLEANLTIAATKTITFERGGKLSVDTGNTLTINGEIEAGQYQIFDGTGTLLIRNAGADAFQLFDATGVAYFHKELPALWFRGDDIGAKCNDAFKAGGSNTMVVVPSGRFKLTTTIDLDQTRTGSHLSLRGTSYLATTLEMDAGSSMVGINCKGSDEVHVQDIRVIEGSGARTCACIRGGGTSLKLTNTWTGNAKYGYLLNDGAGITLDNWFNENCDYGVLLGSNYFDGSLEYTDRPGTYDDSGSNPRTVNITNGINFSEGGIAFHRYIYFVTTGVSGTFQVGETITGGTSGRQWVVRCVSSTGQRLAVLWDSDYPGSPTSGETLTGGTSGATCTYSSNNSGVLFSVQISDVHQYLSDINGPAVSIIGVDGLKFGGYVRDNVAGGIYVDNSRSVTLSGNVEDNTTYGVKIKNSDVSLANLVLLDRVSPFQKESLLIEGDSKVFGTTIQANGVAAGAGELSFSDSDFVARNGVKFDGVNDFASAGDLSAWYAANATLDVGLTIHSSDSNTDNSTIFHVGEDNGNYFAIHQLATKFQAVLCVSGVCRSVAWNKKFGTYNFAINKAAADGSKITVTFPDGTTDTDDLAGTGLTVGSPENTEVARRNADHDLLDFDGADDKVVSASITADYTGNNSITVEFDIHEFASNTGIIWSFGSGTNDVIAAFPFTNNLRFTQKVSGAVRAALVPPHVGRWKVTFNKTAANGSRIIATGPDGTVYTDNLTAEGLSQFGNGAFNVGFRPNGAGDRFVDGLYSNFKMYNNGGTLIHHWQGYGHETADWTDLVGVANGTVSGTPVAATVLPDNYYAGAISQIKLYDNSDVLSHQWNGFGVSAFDWSNSAGVENMTLAGGTEIQVIPGLEEPIIGRKELFDAIGNIDISQTFNFDSGNGDTKTATLTDDTAITLTATRPGMYWLLLRGDDGITERLITWSTSVSGSPPASVTSSTYTVIQLFWDGATWHATA